MWPLVHSGFINTKTEYSSLLRSIKGIDMKKYGTVLLVFSALILTGCSSTTSDDSLSAVDDALTSFLGDSVNVSSVKDAYLTSCPSATLGEMADAFMSSPSWSDFPSSTGSTVVELNGDILYDGATSNAIIQFDLANGSFEAVYLGINGIDRNMLLLSSLLTKMCEATY